MFGLGFEIRDSRFEILKRYRIACIVPDGKAYEAEKHGSQKSANMGILISNFESRITL
jgi:hypothetical protein